MAIDILDRLIDGDEHVDVKDAYVNRLPQRKQQRDERLAARAAALAANPSLSLPTAAYHGTFTNPDLGTLTIKPGAEPGRLTILLGDCRLDTGPTDPPAIDQLRILGPAAEDVVLTFVPDPSRTITTITVTVPGSGEFSFGRSAP
jgi:hypothetical protein